MERCGWCGDSLGDAPEVGARLARCSACGVVITRPPPTAQELDLAYGEWYRPDTGRFDGPGDRLLSWARRSAARKIARSAPTGPILDIGSGGGTMLAEWRGTGRVAVGVERADDQHVVPRSNTGDGWAAIILWHSLEHLPAPGAVLDASATALAADGILVVTVPNHDSLQAAAFGDRWLHLDLPRHLSHPSTEILVARLRRAGLRVSRVSRWRGGQLVFGWLHGLVGTLPGTVDLYQAIRRPAAQEEAGTIAPARRVATLVAATLLLPVAAIMAAVEAMLGRPGTIYVEARRG